MLLRFIFLLKLRISSQKIYFVTFVSKICGNFLSFSNAELLFAVTQLSVTFSESPSCLPEYIPLTLFLVMLQLATSLEPRKLCSWSLCVLRVYCVSGHAFGLCPGFWVRLLSLTWNNCAVALYPSVWGMHFETLPATTLQQTSHYGCYFFTLLRCTFSKNFLLSLQWLSSILTPELTWKLHK